MLPPAAANEVLKLIITSSCHQDKTIWEREKNGCFTVRSAYKMFKCMENNDSHGETSHANRKQQFWKSLWKLKVPNKVKIFVWKACRDGFPTRLNLRKKQVVVDDICQLCSKSVEDTTHALYQCPHLLAGWKNLFPELHLNATNTTFEEVAIHVQESKKTKALEMLFLLAWGSCISNSFKWQLPPQGAFKLNVNGAIFHEQGCAGIGVVLKDCSGEVIMAATKKEAAIQDSSEIELLAIFRG
ncbi:hypothetical protein F2P56_035458 [Juglans regia]|uniref:Reverse transcriptase zinc-binding domain-containing protein n=1 Tax=Juglans regia TaxID=51240 RepID=A0A833TJI9_JUGRE|nr:hypothetical protein F2P56_035458 [Juglans regia]